MVLVPPGKSLDHRFIDNFVSDFLQSDDVFCFAFISKVLFYGVEKHVVPSDVRQCLRRYGNDSVDSVIESDVSEPLVSGPYILEGTTLWQISRLYADTANAFTVCLHSLSNGR